MRHTELIDKEDRELTIETFWKLIPEGVHDNIYIRCGTDPYDRSRWMIVFDAWRDVAVINTVINGWEGGDIVELGYKQELNDELNKAELELEKTLKENPNHLGTVSRLESRIKGLLNLSAYKRWMLDNGFEEISIDDFDFDWGFSDEFSECCNNGNGCQNIVRTKPDSYCWTPPLWIDCEGYACEECVESGEFDEYVLDEYKNEQKSIPEDFDISRLGLVQINDETYENGMHYGMDDSPEPIIEKLNKEGIDVWFKVYPSQFYCSFDVYVKEEDGERGKSILDGVDTYQGYSTAGNCEKALKEASAKMAELPDNEGVKYAKCNADGTADVRLVSQEEFVKGIKD